MANHQAPTQESETTGAGPARRPLHKTWTLLRIVLMRLRFFALLIATGLVFGYWDTLVGYYEKWNRPAEVKASAGANIEFYCPMCPQVLRDEMATCPICMMPLSKRTKVAKRPLPEGVLAEVQLSPHQVKLAKIRLCQIQHEPLIKTIRTMGLVEVDQRKVACIAARVSGRIEKVHVDFTGKTVIAGEPLVDIYSPELSLAVRELITTARAERAGRDGLRTGGMSLLETARRKLRLLGMSAAQIEHILQHRQAADTLTIPAPRGGVVLKKSVVQGKYVREGSPLYEIADLSTVWMQARIYEDQLPYVRLGQEAQACCSAHPGRTFSGKIAFIDPVVDRASRTVKVRMDFDNRHGDLRPGMYVGVTIKVPLTEIEPFKSQIAQVNQGPRGTDDASLIAHQKICPVTKMKLGSMGKPPKMKVGDRTVFLCCKECERALQKRPEKYMPNITHQPVLGVLALPARAVIDTGTRKVVYRQREPGLFEAIEVLLGPRVGDRYPVVRGIEPGDRIAAAGSFLIDAETRLNPAAAAAYFGASGSPSADRTAREASDTKSR